MAETAPLRVQLIAKTEFVVPSDVPWSTETDGGQALVEFAGRACYQSWSKPNPKTATNAGYLQHIIDVGHFSVLEHASVSFYITGISRSCTHELIRHRHFSYSQLSQRYVPENESQIVVPPGMEGDDELQRISPRPPTPAAPPTPSCWASWKPNSLTNPTLSCVASRLGRPPAPCCPTPPKPGSWSRATTEPGGISSRCGPASMPTWKSGGWRSHACVSSSTSRQLCSPILRS